MDKICIVKRRKIGHENVILSRWEAQRHESSQILTFQLTPEQAVQIRSNESYQSLYGTVETPIFITLRLETAVPSKMLKPLEVCTMLQISESTLLRMVKSGTIRSHRIGRQRRFSLLDVMEFLTRGIEQVGLVRTACSSPFWRNRKSGRPAV
jgi:excisionase family DNA binding protein